MRTFEIIAITALLILSWASVIFRINRPYRWLITLPAITAIVLVVQLVFEKFYWQMLPIYAFALLVLIISLIQFFGKNQAVKLKIGIRILRVVGIILASLVLVIALALPYLFPAFSLPQPTGNYTIGTTTFEWVDDDRPETITTDPNDYRDLIVQAWYPADGKGREVPVPLWPDKFGPHFAKVNYMPEFVFGHMSRIPTHTYADLPLSGSQSAFPVIIYSHAYIPGFIGQNTAQMEELASHGYVVFSIAHPYESSAVIYPDSRIATVDDARFLSIQNELKISTAILKKYLPETDPIVKEDLYRQFLSGMSVTTESMVIWSQDTIFVMDQLEKLNRGEISSPFSGNLDLERIGLFGQSLGGATSANVCMNDQRCKAGANMDGIQLGGVIDGAITKPFLLMDSEANSGMNDILFDRFQNDLYRLIIKGSTHFNYTDFPLMTPLFKMIKVAGSIDPYRMESIINSYLVGFFDTYLNGEKSPLFEGPSQSFPEVEFYSQMH